MPPRQPAAAPEPSLAALVVTLVFGLSGLGAMLGWAAFIAHRTFCAFDTLFPR